MKSIACFNLLSVTVLRSPAIQPYRKRLIDAGIIEAPRRGELIFAVPYLADFLLNSNVTADLGGYFN